MASVIDTVVNLCKRRGLVYQAGEIYGGSRSAWDYGPLGVELKENIKRQWWRHMVQSRSDVVGVDTSVIQPRQVWVEESAPARAEALVDDDELAASLARARRQRAKASMKKVTPAMVAQSVAAHQDEAPAADGLLFDGTSNFVQQIVERKEAPRRSAPEHASPAADAEAHEVVPRLRAGDGRAARGAGADN